MSDAKIPTTIDINANTAAIDAIEARVQRITNALERAGSAAGGAGGGAGGGGVSPTAGGGGVGGGSLGADTGGADVSGYAHRFQSIGQGLAGGGAQWAQAVAGAIPGVGPILAANLGYMQQAYSQALNFAGVASTAQAIGWGGRGAAGGAFAGFDPTQTAGLATTFYGSGIGTRDDQGGSNALFRSALAMHRAGIPIGQTAGFLSSFTAGGGSTASGTGSIHDRAAWQAINANRRADPTWSPDPSTMPGTDFVPGQYLTNRGLGRAVDDARDAARRVGMHPSRIGDALGTLGAIGGEYANRGIGWDQSRGAAVWRGIGRTDTAPAAFHGQFGLHVMRAQRATLNRPLDYVQNQNEFLDAMIMQTFEPRTPAQLEEIRDSLLADPVALHAFLQRSANTWGGDEGNAALAMGQFSNTGIRGGRHLLHTTPEYGRSLNRADIARHGFTAPGAPDTGGAQHLDILRRNAQLQAQQIGTGFAVAPTVQALQSIGNSAGGAMGTVTSGTIQWILQTILSIPGVPEPIKQAIRDALGGGPAQPGAPNVPPPGGGGSTGPQTFLDADLRGGGRIQISIVNKSGRPLAFEMDREHFEAG